MYDLKIKGWIVLLALLFCQYNYAQTKTDFQTISLNDLDAFLEPPQNWIIAADASADFSKVHDLKAIKGTGALVNIFSKNNRMHLYTKEAFGDIEIELDFMMAKNSNSGVYLQGRYEIQLLDSWAKLNSSYSDAGGIYGRWNEQRGMYEGTAPAMNVARAPGLWQHLQIKFRAPHFNDKGEKILNARFEEVHLNGMLVQQSAFVTGPTGSSMFQNEIEKGPLVLQGDHGPVAFKNIRYRKLEPLQEINEIRTNSLYWEYRNPIYINPQSKNYLLRSFFEYNQKKLTHVISVGSPQELNFAYDIKQGALLEIWRGKFLDVTRMWNDRGEPQLAKPLGSVILFNDAPAVAVLANENIAWPDSVAFDDLQPHGYLLNKQRTPVFNYTILDANVKDSIACEPNGEGITRAITVANAPVNLFCKVIDGKDIKQVSDNLYAVDDRTFYIRLDKKFTPIIRTSAKGKEIIVRYNSVNPLIYSIIW